MVDNLDHQCGGLVGHTHFSSLVWDSEKGCASAQPLVKFIRKLLLAMLRAAFIGLTFLRLLVSLLGLLFVRLGLRR
ncbi:hypothetical protein KW826_09970 [Pseudoxanthomonas sp. PXM05]|nr:hypothetical protein [Pseudoxanthomonas sp. PXM05]